MYKIIWKDHAGSSHEVHKTSTYEEAEAWVMKQVDADIEADKDTSYSIRENNWLWD